MSKPERCSIDGTCGGAPVHRFSSAARLGIRTIALGALVGASVLTTAGPAQALTAVRKSGSELLVTTSGSVSHNIVVSTVGGFFTVTDTGDTLFAGLGCGMSASVVRCSTAGISVVRVTGGNGNDRLTANVGVGTVLRGGNGNDALSGGTGPDVLDGGFGADRMRGGPGIDTVGYSGRTMSVGVDLDDVADDGQSFEFDNAASDIEGIVGGNGNDLLTGTSGANAIAGMGGNDSIHGLGGDDFLSGGVNNDFLDGGLGNDTYSDSGVGDGADIFTGGPGFDTASYASRTAPLRVSLDGVADDGVTGERDNNRADVERLVGGTSADVLTGNASANNIQGGAGNDSLTGGAGNDSLTGGAGNDLMNGDAGNDQLFGRDGVSGNDILRGGNNIDTCVADAGDTRTGCEI
jgi:Ca2+-binding RTX toxin-like protein